MARTSAWAVAAPDGTLKRRAGWPTASGPWSVVFVDGVVMMNDKESVLGHDTGLPFQLRISAAALIYHPPTISKATSQRSNKHENVPTRISLRPPQEAETADGKTSLRSPGWQSIRASSITSGAKATVTSSWTLPCGLRGWVASPYRSRAAATCSSTASGT